MVNRIRRGTQGRDGWIISDVLDKKIFPSDTSNSMTDVAKPGSDILASCDYIPSTFVILKSRSDPSGGLRMAR